MGVFRHLRQPDAVDACYNFYEPAALCSFDFFFFFKATVGSVEILFLTCRYFVRFDLERVAKIKIFTRAFQRKGWKASVSKRNYFVR